MRSLWRHLSALNVVLAPIRDRYDYILVDPHPDINDLLRTILYACDYVCPPVKLDLQSTIGVPSAIEAINNGDLEKSHAQYFVMVMLINRAFRMP